MDRGTDVVMKAGQGQLGGAAASTDGRPGLEEAYGAAFLGENDGSGKPIGSGADDDRVGTGVSQGR